MKLPWWNKEKAPEIISVFYRYNKNAQKYYDMLDGLHETLEEAISRSSKQTTHILEIRSDLRVIFHEITGRSTPIKAIEAVIKQEEKTYRDSDYIHPT